MRRLWLRTGEIPALQAFTVFYAALLSAVLVLDDPSETVVVVALVALFIAYCVARPDHRYDVFAYSFAPGSGGSLLHELFGISRHWGLLALLVVLPALREIDRETVRPSDSAEA